MLANPLCFLSGQGQRMQFDQLKRREFITLLGGAVAAWPLAARAQQPERMRRIGVLMALSEDDPEARVAVAALQQGLDSLGWILGRNLQIEYRSATDPDRVRLLAKDLVGLHPDVIVSRSTPVLRALMRETRTIPIVFTQVVEADRQGIVETLSRPGGNVTGFTPYEASMGTKWLELLKEIAPDVKRVAVLFNPSAAPYADLFFTVDRCGCAVARNKCHCNPPSRPHRNRARHRRLRT